LELEDNIAAVAIDPVLDGGESSSQYCIGVQPLLEKYLVLDD